MRPFGTVMETKPSTVENTWRVNAFGAFLCAQEVIPGMLARPDGEKTKGVILLTGATGGVKPAANSAAFGPSKFAMRGFGQVMARDLQPKVGRARAAPPLPPSSCSTSSAARARASTSSG
jgi:NAD(P)-dependent dehydrogenase (short-subunit alcohol dehydrogenase family)